MVFLLRYKKFLTGDHAAAAADQSRPSSTREITAPGRNEISCSCCTCTGEENPNAVMSWMIDLCRPSLDDIMGMTEPLADFLSRADPDDPQTQAVSRLLDHLVLEWLCCVIPPGRIPLRSNNTVQAGGKKTTRRFLATGWNKFLGAFKNTKSAASVARAGGNPTTRLSSWELLKMTAPLAEFLCYADDNDPNTKPLCRLLDHLITEWRAENQKGTSMST
ncbi:hypothetical protein PR202_gb20833 [Eleusine coracana subsp. coracana]|uniref:Uncharacterized protein n=1 Tax=Eleusine coracana subsp. coracana TaxID=191504 RepID=A0AAV5FCF2_ELECO|nr:hypothetical protein PR202_gb20833 [Eleusine coracana subsp. coracana]